ncbi:hypothetical protein [Paenibacillus sp. Marseille-Q4541]|uniref:hypothetical protein n=1 Tax=Paenibacillus sp. Marseille-Q4541 TaxID=2831522 RepID=UPI001BA7FE8E|nr:hypothetical protein [Paenibacillus sp. Marseille-Q4541]
MTLDYTVLAKYGRIQSNLSPDSVRDITLLELIRPEYGNPWLEIYQRHLQAETTGVAAVYVMHTVSGLLVAAHYMISMCDTYMDISLSNVSLQMELNDSGAPQLSFVLHNKEEYKHTNRADAAERQQMLERFYGGTLRPLVEGMAAGGGVPVPALWGQFPNILAYYLNLFKEGLPCGEQHLGDRLTKDHEAVKQFAPELFNRKKNPFDIEPVYIENPLNSEKPYRMKSACCEYYRISDGKNRKCYTCPRMKAEERAERAEEMRGTVLI